ncbi:uncharacterized protein LOC127791918 isoform X2 [Diospyros lotus]|nr:uncharacterized protein LOC127791918 isoform X2 [Diospyros lotus]
MQSYLSHLGLFLASDNRKLYILVDNRPWLKDLGARSAHLWQLMVTKSRLSPFARTKARKQRRAKGKLLELTASAQSDVSKSKKFKRWFSLVDAATLSRKRALLPVKKLRTSLILNSKLQRTLYGFIVFEVAWSDVRGINYLNELQTDTSFAIETKLMRRWEFDSIAQAVKHIPLWFLGTHQEQLLFRDYLESIIGEVFHDAQEYFPRTSIFDDDDTVYHDTSCSGNQSPCHVDNYLSPHAEELETESSTPRTPPAPDGPNKRRKVMKSISIGFDVNMHPEETCSETVDSPIHSRTSSASDSEDAVEANEYKDVLILLRFNDRHLPFELREIIMSDLRLLTLLEAGLPSWVLFVQSYPVFCHLYRPWMCPMARTLYVLISVVTVLIGFYDLYKNVPVLKATASRLCGPLLDWIETWEMVSRIKYLGTMLFLHNVEKAIKWFLMFTRTIRSSISFLTQPMAGPLLDLFNFMFPVWNMCFELVESLSSVIWLVIESSFNLAGGLVEIILLPLWFILSSIWHIAIFIIYPLFRVLWEMVYAPIRLVAGLVTLVSFICTYIYDLLLDLWLFVSGIIKLASTAEATVSTYEVSMWRSLWNDLFSQIFRAVRSILHGFVAFFTACNRHRLSIYNHSREFVRRLAHRTRRLRPAASSSHRVQTLGIQNLAKSSPYLLKNKKEQS